MSCTRDSSSSMWQHSRTPIVGYRSSRAIFQDLTLHKQLSIFSSNKYLTISHDLKFHEQLSISREGSLCELPILPSIIHPFLPLTSLDQGEVKLPARDQMIRDFALHKAAIRKRYVDTPRHTFQVDWVPYMDELAELTGCKPNLGQDSH